LRQVAQKYGSHGGIQPYFWGMPRLIHAEKLAKSYGDVQVLQNLDFALESGEFVAVTGPSGSGKSTLLHLLAGLEQPDSGILTFDGRPYPRSGSALNRFRNEQLGLVFQFHHLMPELTALENILLPAAIAGSVTAEVQSRAAELLKQLDVAHRSTHRPDALSGGEQQRVAIARALINQPQVLLADEPSGNLDGARAEELYRLLDDARSAYGVAVVVVTHSEGLAARADRRLTLRNGQWT